MWEPRLLSYRMSYGRWQLNNIPDATSSCLSAVAGRLSAAHVALWTENSFLRTYYVPCVVWLWHLSFSDRASHRKGRARTFTFSKVGAYPSILHIGCLASFSIENCLTLWTGNLLLPVCMGSLLHFADIEEKEQLHTLPTYFLNLWSIFYVICNTNMIVAPRLYMFLEPEKQIFTDYLH